MNAFPDAARVELANARFHFVEIRDDHDFGADILDGAEHAFT